MYVLANMPSRKLGGAMAPSSGYWLIRIKQILNKNNHLVLTTKYLSIKTGDENYHVGQNSNSFNAAGWRY